jgi:serine/threonine-protein kinase HipA
MSARTLKQQASICIGRAGLQVGDLTFVRDGRREYSAFVYQRSWLERVDRFEISPDLPLRAGHLTRRAPSAEESPFPYALADTAPDAWGKRIIQRAHAKRRQRDPSLGGLTRFDVLAAVDDFSRVGALRLRNSAGQYLSAGAAYRTPQLVELEKIYASTRAFEQGTETEGDLAFLQGKATSLGGLRPKCTVLDADGTLALGKFPSITDTRSIVRGEVLALKLARLAKLDAAEARIEMIEGTPVAIIRRFDRTPEGRIAYLSAGSLLQARRDEDRSYTELADVLRRISAQPSQDVRELWRRVLFNLLITNVDDHLWNIGVLYAGEGRWRLAPAFDVNPFPDRVRESKTCLSEDTGPVTSAEQLIDACAYFGLEPAEARQGVTAMAKALSTWREVATSKEVGLTESELEAFVPAFEHRGAREARAGAPSKKSAVRGSKAKDAGR